MTKFETSTLTLSQNHRTELCASGLTDATITSAGIYSATSGQVRDILGWARKGVDWGPAMVFPYQFPEEPEPAYRRLKPDFPRSNGKGKCVKYESPRGTKNRAYFPPGFLESFGQSAQTVVITEGEKKALATTQAGFPCIGLPGDWGWQDRRKRSDTGRAYGERRLIPDLDALDWKDRSVVILFDSDAATNDGVQLAEARLAETLAKAGAI